MKMHKRTKLTLSIILGWIILGLFTIVIIALKALGVKQAHAATNQVAVPAMVVYVERIGPDIVMERITDRQTGLVCYSRCVERAGCRTLGCGTPNTK